MPPGPSAGSPCALGISSGIRAKYGFRSQNSLPLASGGAAAREVAGRGGRNVAQPLTTHNL